MSEYFRGVEEFAKRLQQVKLEEKKAARKSVRAVGVLILRESNAHVPHEEGDFQRGGRVSMDDEKAIAAVSYRDTAYRGQADQLHEDLTLKHDTGRHAKFLERALAATLDRARQILGKEMKAGMHL